MSRRRQVSRSEWLRLSRRLASPWPTIQRRNGSFPDAFTRDGSSRYGDAMLGYGLLEAGTRDRDRRLVRSGIRGVNATTGRLDPWFATRGFKAWAVAAAYNVARERLGHWVSARRAMRRWARWLKHQPTTFLHLPGYQNKHLVDAVAVLEMQRSGLRSAVPGAILGTGRHAARRRAIELINRRVPAMASAYVLSDPGTYPITYHAISYAMYARAVRLLGPRAGGGARAALRELGRTAWQATAPDGDFAYWGRSMGQSWALSASAYGLAATAARSSGPWPERYRSLAHRLLRRLDAYGVGPRGEWTTPSLRQDFRAALRSLDGYARATEYTGLALVYVNWAIPVLPKRSALALISSDRRSRAVVGQGNGRFAVVRHGNVWFAVRQYGGRDLRYDFGPIAVKRLQNGAWRDVIPLRPHGGGTLGPLLLKGGMRGAPVGMRISSLSDGSVRILGGFRTVKGRWLRRGVVFSVRPSPCGVEVSVGGRPGDLYEFSAFFRGNLTRPVIGSTSVVASGQALTFNLPLQRRFFGRGGYASASDARLSRGRFRVRPLDAQPVSMAIC